MNLDFPQKIKASVLACTRDSDALIPSRNRRNMFLSAMSALFYIVVLGMVTSYSSPATVDMQRKGSRFVHITPDQITWIASLPPLAGVVGNALSGYISHKLGRKSVLMYTSASFTFSWLVIAYAPTLTFVYMGRIMSGFCAGICSVAVPAYVVEVSTVESRGFLTAGFQVAYGLGVFFVMALGIFLRWSWLAVAGAMVVAVGACLMYWMPESPSWLVRASKNSEAIRGLKFLRGTNYDAMREFREIVEHLSDEPKSGWSCNEFLNPALYKPTLIAIALMFFQQFSGVNALMSYAEDLFRRNGSVVDPSVAAMLVALVQVVSTVASSLMMDKVGRRSLYMISGACMSVSLIVSGAYSYASRRYEASHHGWIPMACFMLYMASFSMGFGPIPFVVTPEMVPTMYRSFLLAVASVSSSFFGFVVTKIFEDMRGTLGMYGVYWTYSAFAFSGFVFYWIFVPETKGRPIREIHRSFSIPRDQT